jgi:hypothetical protein
MPTATEHPLITLAQSSYPSRHVGRTPRFNWGALAAILVAQTDATQYARVALADLPGSSPKSKQGNVSTILRRRVGSVETVIEPGFLFVAFTPPKTQKQRGEQ